MIIFTSVMRSSLVLGETPQNILYVTDDRSGLLLAPAWAAVFTSPRYNLSDSRSWPQLATVGNSWAQLAVC